MPDGITMTCWYFAQRYSYIEKKNVFMTRLYIHGTDNSGTWSLLPMVQACNQICSNIPMHCITGLSVCCTGYSYSFQGVICVLLVCLLWRIKHWNCVKSCYKEILIEIWCIPNMHHMMYKYIYTIVSWPNPKTKTPDFSFGTVSVMNLVTSFITFVVS